MDHVEDPHYFEQSSATRLILRIIIFFVYALAIIVVCCVILISLTKIGLKNEPARNDSDRDLHEECSGLRRQLREYVSIIEQLKRGNTDLRHQLQLCLVSNEEDNLQTNCLARRLKWRRR